MAPLSRTPKLADDDEDDVEINNEDEEQISDDGGSEEEELERVLAEIPFGDLQRARADGSLAPCRRSSVNASSKPKRANKNRPMEVSSKVRTITPAIQAPKKVFRDPRFDSLSGNLDTEGFRKRYNFLFESELPTEKEKVQKLIKKSKDPKAIEEMKSHISWIDKQIKSAPRKSVESEILSRHIKNEREAAKSGKQPYYLKKSEIRKRKLIQKYEELKAEGKLDSYMEKRRRKNAAKDHRYMPYRRPADDTQT